MAKKTIVSSGAVAVVCSAWHYKLADSFEAERTTAAASRAMVKEKYGEKSPTFDQCANDRKALQAIAEEKQRDYIWMRRCYSSAIMALYGQLPESTDPDSIRRREERQAKKAQAKQVLIDAKLTKAPKDWKPVDVPTVTKSNAGAPQGEVKDQKVSYGEQLEQFIARHDLFEVLDAVARILADDKKTETEAAGLASIARRLRSELQPRKAGEAPREAPREAPKEEAPKEEAPKEEAPKKQQRKPRGTQNNAKKAA